jgi:hypothetical protein
MREDMTSIPNGSTQFNPTAQVTQKSVFDVPPFEFLTPDLLIQFCEMKLRGLDEQIKAGLAKQKLRNSQNAALSDLASSIGKYKTGANSNDIADINAAFDTAMKAFPEGSETYKQLAEQKAKLTEDAKDGVNTNDISGYVSNVTNLQQSLNRDGELEMLQLQSLTQQRATALQMCTNMVGSIGDTAKAIAAKIGG